jgi:hypothetical protein
MWMEEILNQSVKQIKVDSLISRYYCKLLLY